MDEKQYEVRIGGPTYPFRHSFKSAGMGWDSTHNEWYNRGLSLERAQDIQRRCKRARLKCTIREDKTLVDILTGEIRTRPPTLKDFS